jgi:hypothetical protein
MTPRKSPLDAKNHLARCGELGTRRVLEKRSTSRVTERYPAIPGNDEGGPFQSHPLDDDSDDPLAAGRNKATTPCMISDT